LGIYLSKSLLLFYPYFLHIPYGRFSKYIFLSLGNTALILEVERKMKKIFAVAVATVMTLAMSVSAFAATEDRVVYQKNTYALDGDATTVESMDNPLLNLDASKIVVEFTVTSQQQFAAWPMVACFYNLDDNDAPRGAAAVNYWPKIELNKFDDPNQWCSAGSGEANNGGTIYADTHCDGQPHTYKYEITDTAVVMTVDGTVITTKYGYGDGASTDAECAAMILDYMNTAAKFSLGAGSNIFTWGELTGTLENFKITATVEATEPTPTEGTETEDATETGDMTAVLPVAILAVAAMAVVVVMRKRTVAE